MARILLTNCSPDGGGLYLLDTGSAQLKRLFDQSCRGMTWGPDGLYVVRDRGEIYRVDLASGAATLRAETGLRGCHDLRWIDGWFYLVACYGNQVLRLHADLKPVDTLQVVADPADVCHANCLAHVDGELLLSIFTLTPGERSAKNGTPVWRTEGKILRLDWERKGYDILFEPLSQPHSLVRHDGRLYCCESHAEHVASVSLERGTKEVLHRLHGFVRGLAFADGKLYVGVTHKRLKHEPIPKRWIERLRWWCGVLEIDPATGRIERRFKVPGTDVYELMTLEDGMGG